MLLVTKVIQRPVFIVVAFQEFKTTFPINKNNMSTQQKSHGVGLYRDFKKLSVIY